MENLLAYTVLLSFSVFLGIGHTRKLEKSYSGDSWKLHNSIAAVVFVAYLLLLVFKGKEGIYELQAYSSDYRKFGTFFLYPSIGFGLTIFPKAAYKYATGLKAIPQKMAGSIMFLVGWVMIGILILTILVP